MYLEWKNTWLTCILNLLSRRDGSLECLIDQALTTDKIPTTHVIQTISNCVSGNDLVCFQSWPMFLEKRFFEIMLANEKCHQSEHESLLVCVMQLYYNLMVSNQGLLM